MIITPILIKIKDENYYCLMKGSQQDAAATTAALLEL